MHQFICHYMTPSPRTIGPEESLHRARQIMQSCAIRHLPVVSQVAGRDELHGILTERDIRILEGCGRTLLDVRVKDAMTPEPFAVSGDAPLQLVAQKMAEKKFGSALVVEGGKVIGIFCAIDALRALADIFEEYFSAPTSDRFGRIVPPRVEP